MIMLLMMLVALPRLIVLIIGDPSDAAGGRDGDFDDPHSNHHLATQKASILGMLNCHRADGQGYNAAPLRQNLPLRCANMETPSSPCDVVVRDVCST